jgi:hypothetical protein
MSFDKIGIKKAAVFPEPMRNPEVSKISIHEESSVDYKPVCAQATTS